MAARSRRLRCATPSAANRLAAPRQNSEKGKKVKEKRLNKPQNAKADIAVAIAGVVVVAIRRPAIAGVIVPTAAANDAIRA